MSQGWIILCLSFADKETETREKDRQTDTQITNIRNKRGERRHHYRFNTQLPKLTQKEIDNLDSCRFIKEVEFVILKNLPVYETPSPDSFPGKFYKKKLREEKVLIL